MNARRHDLSLALALAALLSVAWTIAAWADLRQLRLPDTDDAMRLQQVRDWLAGQAFGDVAQHRLGLGGPIHWSRLVDLPIAAPIALFSPLGRHDAEVAAVIVWPALLFAAALYLTARIARVLGAPVATAVVVAGIAYPSTTVFLPGRIDHHGVQLVMVLGALLGALGPVTARRGRAAGLCCAASLVVGLETVPLLGVIGAAIVAEWVASGGRRRLAGLGGGALGGLIVGRMAFASDAFGYGACDGFTAEAWRAAMVMAAATLLPLVTPDPSAWLRTGLARGHAVSPTGDDAASRLKPGMRGRLRRGLAIIGIAGAVALLWSPDCLHPYGRVDPLLARLWLGQVAEAQGAWQAPFAATIGYLGVMAAGLGATAWRLRVVRTREWALMLALQVTALAVALVQLRGAQSGAILAAPALAAAIDAARRRGSVALVGAWAASAGMLYPIAAQALTPPSGKPAPMAGDCGSAATMAALVRLPAGTLMAPIDAGAWALAATRHRVLGAPLHRNAAGNRAIYRFYLRPPGEAAATLRRWNVRYIVACGTMPGADRRGTTADALIQGKLPGVRPLVRSDDGSVIYLSDSGRTL
ncbi:hypothetical protein GGQ80_002676 [Sphingomonas jinjuensis]|uniref:4-amino-4-deoxy-L-arabinose transferase n=1 Tax=Sphingomonas jinjuensis TaxID=535907 RepID=A0A840F9T4_9SPHN|nr:hypothetical protein [Sphingomonas jinjuensis]MBB4154760.1 hypothetical protein [Sphingomonas jinjuensis]